RPETVQCDIDINKHLFVKKNKLPGPFPWVPLLGNALDLFKYRLNLPEYIKAVQLKYGDICEIYMGPKRIIILSRSDIVYPIYTPSVAHNSKFLYRDSPNPGLNEIDLEKRGVIVNRNLAEWKVNRRFLEKTIMSKKFLKEFMEKEHEICLNMFKLWNVLSVKRQEIDLAEWVTKFAGDATFITVTGQPAYSIFDYFESLGYEHNRDHIPVSEWRRSPKLISAVLSIFNIIPWFLVVPSIIRHAPGLNFFNQKLLKNVGNLNDIILEIVRERRAYIDSLPIDTQIPSDVLSLLLTANTKRDSPRTLIKSLDRSLDDQEVGGIMKDIFLGSFETVTYYLRQNFCK
ncbi:8856_t:CDS:2, partial [Gigaspora margarita]